MSYWISLYTHVDTGGPEPERVELEEVGNYTSNVAPMWSAALGRSLGDLSEQPAGAVLPDLEQAVAAMEADPARFEAMNPKNGWGDYAGALGYLRRLRDACARHPKSTVRISH
ncbi:hypothetical protein AB0F46_41320 [Streptomyces sp. NPDC026665]|uniref:hypothetical protein n=1 Tax=Streptomyces sp. NPDC026665 TaxID=3154798 RepID=UPI003401495E